MRRPRFELVRCRISSVPLKSAIGIVAIVALFGRSVQAADLPVAPSSAPIPVSSPSWTGLYIGLDFGVRYDAVDANVTSATVGTPPTAIALPPATATNFNVALRGGVYGGWNYQITPEYVAGVEADFGWANETANLHGSAYPNNFVFGSPSFPFGATPLDIFRVTTKWDGSCSAADRQAHHPLDLALCERRFGLGQHSSYIDLFR